MNLQDPAEADEGKDILESLLVGPVLEVWMQMKEENRIDPLQELDKVKHQEVVRNFLLEVITIETAADTLAWLKNVCKPYDMKLPIFLKSNTPF